MDFIIFALVYGPLWLLTWLPLPVLYFFSDFFAILMWYLIPYRKKMIIKNLVHSFPEKSKSEIKKLARNNIHFFCDSFIESLAAFHLPQKKVMKRYKVINSELIDALHADGKDIMLMAGHFGNWEWICHAFESLSYAIMPVYKTLNNKYFDKLFIRIRSKSGAIPVSRENTLRTMTQFQHEGKKLVLFSVADQRPRWIQIQHWITFMNQDTPVVLGPEKIARKFNMTVVFYKVTRIRRGHYTIELIPFEDHILLSTKPPVITEKYYQLLEQQIRDQPEYYLWAHNRWKHKKDGSHIKQPAK